MRVTSVPNGAGRIDVTVTAGAGALRSIRFGTPTNARIDIGSQVGMASGFTATLPSGSRQASFIANQVDLSAPMTVPFVANDDCGDWTTFVGGGAVVSAPGAQTITFDDRPGQNQTLNGQYPSGVIDWGSGSWFHSGPYGSFRTNSVSFSQGVTSRSLTFVTPRRLVSVQAYNGGAVSSTVTLSCAGQPTKTVTLAAKQLTTIATGWAGTCPAVTIGSSNGWDTNFDNMVIDGG
jgi:hypothetical protein